MMTTSTQQQALHFPKAEDNFALTNQISDTQALPPEQSSHFLRIHRAKRWAAVGHY